LSEALHSGFDGFERGCNCVIVLLVWFWLEAKTSFFLTLIHIPDIEAKGNSVKVTRFALEVNPAVRALNSAQVVNNNL